MKRHFKNCGFSVVDLQAVLAAGVVLISMLLPAIQNVRENSRATVCENRLRRMALATLDRLRRMALATLDRLRRMALATLDYEVTAG